MKIIQSIKSVTAKSGLYILVGGDRYARDTSEYKYFIHDLLGLNINILFSTGTNVL